MQLRAAQAPPLRVPERERDVYNARATANRCLFGNECPMRANTASSNERLDNRHPHRDSESRCVQQPTIGTAAAARVQGPAGAVQLPEPLASSLPRPTATNSRRWACREPSGPWPADAQRMFCVQPRLRG